MNIPAGHQTIMPYLMLVDAEQFNTFTQNVFNASIDTATFQKEGERIRHAEIMIGKSTIMFTEATDEWKPQTANLFVYVENADETFQKALNAGATVVMDLSTQHYGRTCGVLDPCGNTWWITSV